jgi:ferritin-like metal-binding protein YciE
VPAKELNERDAKLVQWLQEAHAKESELEMDLTAHIALTEKPAYKKRLRKHLTETRDHKRKVASRIKKLGGSLDGGVSGAVAEVAGKGVAAVKGQVGAIRAAVTEQAETHLRNVQEELREEHVEITLYNRIEAFANQVGDKDTARLVAAIRREEERMAKFLHAEMMRLVRDVVRAEIPKEQRGNGGARRNSAGSRRSTAGTGTSRATAAKAR